LYEYECVKCHKKTEKIEKVDGPHLKKCPHCGGKVQPLISRSAIQFKGAGWYVTDYAGKKSTGESSSSEKSDSKDASTKDSPTKDSSEKSSKDSKESKDTKESKPAAEKKTERKKN
jgi:putative FmdB family regulatory protein